MKIRNQRGVTLTMLVVSIVAMLIIATILINFSIHDESIFKNAKTTTFEEEMTTIKSKVDEKIVTKQNVEGRTTGVTLTEEEKKEIIGDYYTSGKLDVNGDGKLCRSGSGNWSEDETKILDKIGINPK